MQCKVEAGKTKRRPRCPLSSAEFPLPGCLIGRVDGDRYRRWVWRCAVRHARRDRNRGWKGACAHGYALMIRDAVVRCGGHDFYTRRPMSWERLGEFDAGETQNNAEYLREFDDYPSVDHAKPGPPAEFEICALWVNRAKGVLTWHQFLAATRELVTEADNGGALLAGRAAALAAAAPADNELRRERRKRERVRERWLRRGEAATGCRQGRRARGRRSCVSTGAWRSDCLQATSRASSANRARPALRHDDDRPARIAAAELNLAPAFDAAARSRLADVLERRRGGMPVLPAIARRRRQQSDGGAARRLRAWSPGLDTPDGDVWWLNDVATAVHNSEIAAVFFEMADLLAVRGGDVHRSKAFSRAARVIEKLPEPVSLMLKKGTLEEVPGIGEGTVHRIKQILRTGSCDTHRQLLGSLPAGLAEMLKIRGVGPGRLRVIYSHLRIASVDALEAAARAGLLAGLPRMGASAQEQILHGILTYRTRIDRVPLATALRRAEELMAGVADVPGVIRAEVAGSLRRRKESSKDLDILVAADDREAVTQRFMQLPQVLEVMIGHSSRASVRLRNGMQADIRVLAPEEFGAGMHYFTGSKDHNIAMRNRANRMGMHLSDHGLFTREKEVLINTCPAEEDVFAGLGLPFIPPELREDTGEIQAAERGMLPQLVTEADVRGDLHMHTTFSDGSGSAEEMARAAVDKGLRCIAITDHSYSLRERLGQQREQLQAMRGRYEKHGLRILQGVEVDISATGELEMDLEVLAQMDFVVASVHNQFELPYEVATQRLIRAMESGVVDVIGHPTGRRFSRRPPAAIDMERVLDAARRCNVAMEINGQPDRLDLDAISARHAVELGVALSINSDAHSTAEQLNQRLALFTARRAWAEPRNLINCWSVNAVLRWRHDRLRKTTVSAGWDATVLPPPPPEDEPEAPVAEADDEPPAERPGGDNADDLAALFRQTPLAPPLLARLQAWMQNGNDAPLQAALEKLGDPGAAVPLQVAFNLAFQSQGAEQPASRTDDDRPIGALELPPRVQAALEKAGILTLPALLEQTRQQISQVSGIGQKAVEQIESALLDAGLALRKA